MKKPAPLNGRTPVATYARMSTDRQQYSIGNQEQALDEYAVAHRMDVVRRYRDEGKSGLTVDRRKGLKQLLADVLVTGVPFSAVLVYDVSRWGRFQNTDQAAYYDYTCRMHGIEVVYTAEQFANDGTPFAAILKSLKRAMAGEYSRELSVKCRAGQARLVKNGYKMGGSALYGTRRLVVDERGAPRTILQAGERKSIQSDHVVLVPGPEHEVAMVRRIFKMFNEGQVNVAEIVRTLNEEGLKTHQGVPFRRAGVHRMLRNEGYIGNNVWGRTTHYLRGPGVPNPEAQWLRKDECFEPVVDKATFAKAQRRIALNVAPRLNREQMLEFLRSTLHADGQITAWRVEDRGGPNRNAYKYEFGSLTEAYRLIGYEGSRRHAMAEANNTRKLSISFANQICEGLSPLGYVSTLDRRSFTLAVNGQWLVGVTLAYQAHPTAFRETARWLLSDRDGPSDFLVIVRIDAQRQAAKDFFIVPAASVDALPSWLVEKNGTHLEAMKTDGRHLASRLALLLAPTRPRMVRTRKSGRAFAT